MIYTGHIETCLLIRILPYRCKKTLLQFLYPFIVKEEERDEKESNIFLLMNDFKNPYASATLKVKCCFLTGFFFETLKDHIEMD